MFSGLFHRFASLPSLPPSSSCLGATEKSDASRSGGCFHGDSVVESRKGPLNIRDLRLSDEVLALDTSTGKLHFSPVLLFLDRHASKPALFTILRLESGRNVTLTPLHLIFAFGDERHEKQETSNEQQESNELGSDSFSLPALASPINAQAIFAKQVTAGQYLLDAKGNRERVLRVETRVLEGGYYAPLTKEGNLFVNGFLASSYAAITNQDLAHMSFLPVRLLANFQDALSHASRTYLRIGEAGRKASKRALKKEQGFQDGSQDGVHWYPGALIKLAKFVLPSSVLM